MSVILGQEYEPPQQESPAGVGLKRGQSNRNTRTLYSLLSGARQAHHGVILAALVRRSEQSNLTGLVEVN